MAATYFDIVPEGTAWVVRCQAAEFGRFDTQIHAFNVAVAEARKIKKAGRKVHVRIVRDSEPAQKDYLALL